MLPCVGYVSQERGAQAPCQAKPIQATCKDDEGISTTDDKRVQYRILFVCVAVKICTTIIEKSPKVIQKLNSTRYVLPVLTVLSILKAIYVSMKLAKDITDFIDYYWKSNKKLGKDSKN
jgi:hypothetical protein